MESSSTSNNLRKRNLLFLTGNKKASLPDSTHASGSSDCEINAIRNRRNNAEKRETTSGPTIDIDISEKIEIRLGQMHTKNAEDISSNNEEENMKDFNDSATKKRKLPDLKPISGTMIVMSRSSERLNENNCKNINSSSELRERLIVPKILKMEDSPSKRRRIIVPLNVINSRRTKWKCKKCSFQHASKEEVVLHVRKAHKQVENDNVDVPIASTTPYELPLQNGDNYLETEGKNQGSEEVSATPTTEPQIQSATRGVGSKAYGCGACPYTTGCKSQFINHARFHRPNNGDFKCKYCTYNVTHKHLLLQHVRVHGVYDISSENITDAKCSVDTTVGPNSGFQNKTDPPRLLFSPKVSKPNGLIRKFGLVKSTASMIATRKINEIKQHNLLKSRETAKTKIYLCNECPARFFEEKLLKTHSNFHSTNFRMKCNACSYSSIQREHLASHMKVHSKVYQFKTRKLLTICIQAQQHPARKQAIGESLRFNSVNDNNIKSTPTVTGSSTNDSIIYCEKCPSKFLSGILYRQHSVYHGKQTSFKCDICNFGTDTNTELAIHKLIHAGSDIEITKGNHWMKFGVFVKNDKVVSPHTGNRAKYYKCNKCPFEFSKRDRYELHLKQHGSNQKYTCTICDFSVNLYVNYVQHLKKHDFSSSLLDASKSAKTDKNNGFIADSSRSTVQNTPQLYKCDICPFYAVDENTVTQHKEQHEIPADNKSTMSPIKEETLNVADSYACSYCDFLTSSNDLLQQHEELHIPLSEAQTLFDEYNSNPEENEENHIDTLENDVDLSQEANDEASSGSEVDN